MIALSDHRLRALPPTADKNETPSGHPPIGFSFGHASVRSASAASARWPRTGRRRTDMVVDGTQSSRDTWLFAPTGNAGANS